MKDHVQVWVHKRGFFGDSIDSHDWHITEEAALACEKKGALLGEVEKKPMKWFKWPANPHSPTLKRYCGVVFYSYHQHRRNRHICNLELSTPDHLDHKCACGYSWRYGWKEFTENP